MRKFILIAVLGLVVSAAFGWWRAAVATQPGAVPTDEWRVSTLARFDSGASQKLGQKIRATDLFITTPLTDAAAAAAEAPVDAGPEKTPAFPKIVSAPLLNDIHHALLLTAEGGFLKVVSGDSLPSGWVIKTVDSRQVIAAFDGEEKRFPVAAYLDTAFDAPEDTKDNMPVGGEN